MVRPVFLTVARVSPMADREPLPNRRNPPVTEHLRLTIDAGVARLLIDRPAKHNAFDQAMWSAFPALVRAAMDDATVRLLIVQAAKPGAFSAGADIGEFAHSTGDPAWRKANQAAIRDTFVTLSRAPKPTLAVVDGDCIGGGCGIALACDLRIASSRARFGITPAKLGLVYPLHDTKLLVDLVGPAQARWMLYTGALLSAAEAARIGLVQQLSANLDADVAAYANAVVAASPHSQRATKAIVARILAGAVDDDPDSAAQFDAAFDRPDFREGVGAFLAKRKPRFGA
jgi:enoyl-CoA hydratase/carnithine racemase